MLLRDEVVAGVSVRNGYDVTLFSESLDRLGENDLHGYVRFAV
jgi:hypothetical protein